MDEQGTLVTRPTAVRVYCGKFIIVNSRGLVTRAWSTLSYFKSGREQIITRGLLLQSQNDFAVSADGAFVSYLVRYSVGSWYAGMVHARVGRWDRMT